MWKTEGTERAEGADPDGNESALLLLPDPAVQRGEGNTKLVGDLLTRHDVGLIHGVCL